MATAVMSNFPVAKTPSARGAERTGIGEGGTQSSGIGRGGCEYLSGESITVMMFRLFAPTKSSTVAAKTAAAPIEDSRFALSATMSFETVVAAAKVSRMSGVARSNASTTDLNSGVDWRNWCAAGVSAPEAAAEIVYRGSDLGLRFRPGLDRVRSEPFEVSRVHRR